MALIDSTKIIEGKIRKIGEPKSANGYMSWTDKDIDKLYSASAERLSFEYNESYWDEFESQLPNADEVDSPKKEFSDTEIDSMYAASSAGLAFDYKKDYWDEFNASLPDTAPQDVPKKEFSDTEIDNMYAASAAGLSFKYDNNYWNEFNDLSAAGNSVLADNEIDELYQESTNDLSFEYKPSYWEEMKLRLRRKRRPDFLWFVTAYSFVGVIGVTMIINGTSAVEESNQAVASSSQIESNNTNSNANSSNDRLIDSKNSNTNSTTNGESNASAVNQSPLDNSNNGPDNLSNPSSSSNPTNPAGPNNPGGNPSNVGPSNTPSVTVPVEPIGVSGTPSVTPVPVVAVVEPSENPKTDTPIETLETNDLATETDERIELPIKKWEGVPLDRSLLTVSPFDFPKRPFVMAYAQAIGGLSQSLVTPSDLHSYSFGIGVGMELNHRSFTYTLGVNGLIENHNDLVLNRTAKVYGFGSEVYKFNIDYKQMYTLEGLIGIGYNFGKHRLDLGVRPSYVVSSRVRIEELGTSSGVLSSSENDYNESRDVYGFMDGIHRFGLKPTIGYAFKITPTMSFGANFGVELMPSINEDFINGVNNKLPIDGQIYFRKTFSFRR